MRIRSFSLSLAGLAVAVLVSPSIRSDEPPTTLHTKVTRPMPGPVVIPGTPPGTFGGVGGPMLGNPNAPLPQPVHTPLGITINDIRVPQPAPESTPAPAVSMESGAIEEVGKKTSEEVITQAIIKAAEKIGTVIGGRAGAVIKEVAAGAENKLLGWFSALIDSAEIARDASEIAQDKQKNADELKERAKALQEEYDERLSEAAKVGTQSPVQKALLESIRHQLNELGARANLAQKDADEARAKVEAETVTPPTAQPKQ